MCVRWCPSNQATWEVGDLPPCSPGLPRTRQWPESSGLRHRPPALQTPPKYLVLQVGLLFSWSAFFFQDRESDHSAMGSGFLFADKTQRAPAAARRKAYGEYPQQQPVQLPASPVCSPLGPKPLSSGLRSCLLSWRLLLPAQQADSRGRGTQSSNSVNPGHICYL